MTSKPRYDAIADFYVTGWIDDLGDPVSACLFDLLGIAAGQRVLDVACGHGRITREVARRGATVVGADISRSLIDQADSVERAEELGVRYLCADVAEPGFLEGEALDAAVCSFGPEGPADPCPARPRSSFAGSPLMWVGRRPTH